MDQAVNIPRPGIVAKLKEKQRKAMMEAVRSEMWVMIIVVLLMIVILSICILVITVKLLNYSLKSNFYRKKFTLAY